jgi:kinesin family protein 2/24
MDINKLSEEHEKLIQVILKNEEDLISDHRTHIDDMVEIVKEVISKYLNLIL